MQIFYLWHFSGAHSQNMLVNFSEDYFISLKSREINLPKSYFFLCRLYIVIYLKFYPASYLLEFSLLKKSGYISR